MEIKEYLETNEITISQAARELGYSRTYFTDVVNKKTPAGKNLAIKLSEWSNGEITVPEAMDIK